MKCGFILLLSSVILSACVPAPQIPNNDPMADAPQETTPTFTPMQPCCTPPYCQPNEVFFCPGECICGCGTTCATVTITPTPMFFPCVDCTEMPALKYFCPLASGNKEALDLLSPMGLVQESMVGEHTCLYVFTGDANWGYVYYVDMADSTLKFVVINPFLLTPTPTVDPNTPIPDTPLANVTATPTPSFFPCVNCVSALDYICPLAQSGNPARELLAPFGEVQSDGKGENSCLYAIKISAGTFGYVYFVEKSSMTVKFAVIDITVLTPFPVP